MCCCYDGIVESYDIFQEIDGNISYIWACKKIVKLMNQQKKLAKYTNKEKAKKASVNINNCLILLINLFLSSDKNNYGDVYLTNEQKKVYYECLKGEFNI